MAQLNDFGDCASDILGTGTTTCDILSYGDYLGKGLLEKGLNFPITNGANPITESVFDGLIQDRKLHQLINRMAFTQDTPENEVYTDPEGFESSIRDGKPKLTTMYNRGGEFHKALYSLRGDNKWDAFLYFTEGMLLATNVAKTALKGFNGGRFDVSTLRFLAGTDPQQGSAIMQFRSPAEFGRYFQFIPWDKLGFDASQKDGVVDASVTFGASGAPTATDTTFSLKVTPASNAGSPSFAAAYDDVLNWAIGGTQATPKTISTVSYNGDTQELDFVVSSAFIAGDTLQPRLRDLTKDVAVDVYGKFAAGKLAEFHTVTA